MNEIHIQGDKFSNYSGAYDELKRAISQGNGETNASSIKELIKMNLSSDKHKVIWLNSAHSKEVLGYKETVRYLKLRMQSVPIMEIVSLSKEIKAAENNVGPTLFDMILESFEKNSIPVELK